VPSAECQEHGDDGEDPEEEVQPYRGLPEQLVAEKPQKERRPE
jgi:hypothetical protein